MKRAFQLLIVLAALAAAMVLCSCSTPSDPAFMQTSAARILPGDGVAVGPNGRLTASRGLDNRNRPHPFYGAP